MTSTLSGKRGMARVTTIAPGAPSRPQPTVTDVKAAALLVELGVVRYISVFGDMLVRHGIIKSDPGKRYARQGLAFIAGKSLARLRRLGFAAWSLDGWRPTESARGLATVTKQHMSANTMEGP